MDRELVIKKTSKLLLYVVLIFLVCIWLLPIISSIGISFKSPEDYLNSKFYNIPVKFWFFNNLSEVFRYYRLYKNIINSLIYSVSGAAVCIFVSSLAAFGAAKLKPKLHFFLFLIIYSGTVFPFQMYLIPLFTMYHKLGIYDTKAGMILFYSAICTPFAMFFYRGFLLGMPDDMMEAALIDGCTPIRMYFQVILPQLISPTAVVILFQAMWIWNDLLFGMILSSSESVRPIMVAIAQAAGTGGGNIPVMMSAVVIASIPTVLLFIALRKYFIKGYVLRAA